MTPLASGSGWDERDLAGHSQVPLYFPEYQDVRQALAQADGALTVILSAVRNMKNPPVRPEGVAETLAAVQDAGAVVARAYRRHLGVGEYSEAPAVGGASDS